MIKISVNFFIDLSNSLKGSGIYSSAIRLQRELLKKNFSVLVNSKNFCNIIHIHTAFPISYLKINRIKAKRKSHLPIIIMHTHTTVEDFVNSFALSSQLKPILEWYLPKLYKIADHLITVSEHNRNLILNYGIPHEKISIISNGIKIDNPVYLKKSIRDQARQKLGLKENQILIIGLGVCIYRKGIDRFIEIAKKLPNREFIWIGKRIPTPFLAHANYLKKKFQKKSSNCRFPGYVSHKTLIGLWNAADIFLFPTREENQGIAFLEAILNEKPAIISNHPVFDEYQDEYHVMKASSIKEFVEKIELLSSDSNLRKKLVSNSKSYLQIHDLNNTVKQVSELYESILKEKLS